MKILVISNLYPPYVIGGYEICCQEIVDYLRSKHHDVHVLTSYYGLKKPAVEDKVYRLLRHQLNKYSPGINDWPKILLPHKDIKDFQRIIKKVNPDRLYIFNLRGLSLQLLRALGQTGVPKIFDFGDDWMIALRSKKRELFRALANPARKKRNSLVKKFMHGLADLRLRTNWENIENQKMIFVSKDLQSRYNRAGLRINNSKVIYNAIDFKMFSPSSKEKNTKNNLKLLFVGQVEEHKGVHIIIDALAKLKTSGLSSDFTLDVVGGNNNPEYGKRLKDLIEANNLQTCITLHGKIDRARLPDFYREADIFIFSSLIEEAFGLTLAEAMGTGLPVISTLVGGTKDFLRDHINCLTFSGDAVDLAQRIKELIQNPDLLKSISSKARDTVVSLFDKEIGFSEREKYLIS